MYFPKLTRKFEYVTLIKGFDKKTVLSIVYAYLTDDFSLDFIQEKLLSGKYNEYSVINILSYYGININHKAVFYQFEYEEVLEQLKNLDDDDKGIADLVYIFSDNKYSDIEIMIDKLYKVEFNVQNKKFSDFNIETSKENEAYFNVMSKIRNNNVQNNFRKRLINEFDSKCALCDIKFKDFVIASHIIPYSRCSENLNVAGDHNNGLLLCPNHDMLFESGNFISINHTDGKIIISKNIPYGMYESLNIHRDFVLSEKYLTPYRKKYLKTHNLMFYDKEKEMCEYYEAKGL